MHSHHIHNHSIRHTLQILSRYWSQEVHPLYSSHGHCPGIDALSSHPQSLYTIRHTLQILSRYWSQEVHPLYSSHGHCPGIDALYITLSTIVSYQTYTTDIVFAQSLYQTYPTDIVSLLITRSTSTLLLTRALSRYWCTLITSTITLSDIPYRYCLAIDHNRYIHSTPHTGIVPVLMHSHYIHNHSIRHTLQILSRYWSQEVHPLYSSHGHCPGIDALSLYTQSLYQTYPTDIVSLLITRSTSTLLLTRALSRYWCTLIIYTITLSQSLYQTYPTDIVSLLITILIDHKKYIHSTPHMGIVPVLMHSHYIHNHSIRHTLQILSRYWSQEVHPLYSSHWHCPGIDALSLYTQSLYQTYPTDIVSLLITIGTSTLLLTRALSRYWCTLITSTITLSDIPYRYCLAIDHKKYIHSTPHTGIVPVLMHSHYIHNHSIRHTLQILSRYWSQ